LINCGGTCIDPGTSQTHCGASDPCAQNPGTTCDPGEVCDGFGQCALSCQQGLTNCNGKCVDNLTDNANCGTCGNACPSGYLCSNGTCSLSCQQGLTQCTGKCVNVLTDNQNCGFCGVACGSGSVCSSGTCQLTCQPGLSICNNKCVDRLTDNAHCGACNNVCPDGFLCTAGECVLTCQEGLVECDETCVDPDNDEAYCGADENCAGYDICGPGEICNGSGVCAASCASPLEACNGACTNFDYDPNNCGACGNNCVAPANGTSVCVQGECKVSCASGFGWDGYNCVSLSQAFLYPARCSHILMFYPSSPDGEYLLFVNHAEWMPWQAHCHNMSSTPLEYLTVPAVGSDVNYSQYTGSTSVRTTYTRLRIDPLTLVVNTADQTFSTSTGSLYHGTTPVTSMPYGVAMSCDGGSSGRANINLVGTPFAITDTVCTGGAGASGTGTFSLENQVLDIVGGGFCGWAMPCPDIYNPFNNRGGWVLNLTYYSAQIPTPT
jgi:hypothetical protein